MKIEEINGKLTITEFDELEAYKIASKIENDGIEFYTKLKDNSQDENLNKLLEFLIQQEREHLKFFQECLYKVYEYKEDNFEEDSLFNYMDFGIFPNIEEIKITNCKELLRFAVNLEDKSIQFYMLCKENIANVSVKNELERIVKEEEQHKILFEDLIKKV